ncbi:maleylacetoacetate isomerase [Novosphingobium sp. MMS21-SN21R]|uniref:maleylacetoacetate isomerase n=1 Tax=Novosphingobium sp. MMS21-SN21R TaxID=2969298 RepID=UPI0028873FBA|nr:maleylacetoacetate isomerase [Novosphingobium sp. MMS21-SN21R]MDT0509540.1 maleylacetoacetate isomerase [Novosphingobium sp. MMS21-SN21R]
MTTDTPIILHGFWRSTASWRVRIALGLKGLEWRGVAHHLRLGEQRAPEYLALNPQGFVPALEVGGAVLTQSLAICEYLDEVYPEPPLLPADPLARAKVRAFAQVIACDIHPVQNLKVLKMLKKRGLDQAATDAWAAEVIESGLAACAALIGGNAGPYCFGDQVTLADVLLVPQLGNARRFGATFDFGRISEIEAACMALPAFVAAAPERQADAE